MGHVDGLPVGVDVERLRPGLAPAGARVLLAAEGHVRLEAVRRAVDLHAAGDDAAHEFLAAVDALRPDRRREAVRACVGRRDGFLEATRRDAAS